MLRLPIRLLLILTLVAALAQQAYATTVTIHTEDARATLLALQNRSLSHEDAMKIAEMHGNQAVLQKLHEFKITSTTQDFANALYATAHGEPITKENEKNILFEIEEPRTIEGHRCEPKGISTKDRAAHCPVRTTQY